MRRSLRINAHPDSRAGTAPGLPRIAPRIVPGLARAAVVVLAATALAGCGLASSLSSAASSAATGTGANPTSSPSVAASTSAGPAITSGPPGTCHSVNGLPDPRCTPGATNPQVTQANIASTICQHGWTATIRPPASYTTGLKRQQIVLYGYTDQKLSDYEEDHLISLEIGGAPSDPANLWPEYDGGKTPNPKDAVENALKRAICSHQVTLAAAQQAIATNWQTAEVTLHLVGG